MVETAKLVDKLKSDTKLPKSLREISDLIVDHGVLFVRLNILQLVDLKANGLNMF
jgi:hypothetical protein